MTDSLEKEVVEIALSNIRKNKIPMAPGHYWGRWHTPAPGTADRGEGCFGLEWEVHQVFENCFDHKDPDYLRVFVPGVEKSQALDSFEWGERVLR